MLADEVRILRGQFPNGSLLNESPAKFDPVRPKAQHQLIVVATLTISVVEIYLHQSTETNRHCFADVLGPLLALAQTQLDDQSHLASAMRRQIKRIMMSTEASAKPKSSAAAPVARVTFLD